METPQQSSEVVEQNSPELPQYETHHDLFA